MARARPDGPRPIAGPHGGGPQGAMFTPRGRSGERAPMKWPHKLGTPLRGIYLLARGLWPLLGIHVPGSGPILAVLALAASVSILFGR